MPLPSNLWSKTLWSKSSEKSWSAPPSDSVADAPLSALNVPDLEPFEPEPQQVLGPSPSPCQLGAPHVRRWWRRIVETAPEIHTNLRALSGELTRPKRIVICADGTWNVPKAVKPGGDAPTNVWLLFQLVKDRDSTGMPQLRYYHAGVGTQRWLPRRMIDGAFGRGLSDNMREAYRFLVNHYNPGDHVYLFGFSRGAYTVRTLAGLIRNSGIVDRRKTTRPEVLQERLDEAYDLYVDRTSDTEPSSPRSMSFRADHSHPDFDIACIGVWDTVGALGIPVESRLTSPLQWWNQKRVGFHDVELSEYVDRAFHALAIDERRGPFEPTLWDQKPEGKDAGQLVEQVWFPGVHSDVGGGYPWNERGLANVSLRWMLKRVTRELRLEFDLYPLAEIERKEPPAVALHDSMEWYYKTLDATRLSRHFDRELGVKDEETEALHASVEKCRATYARSFPVVNRPYAPQNVVRFAERRTGTDRRVDPTGPIPGRERRKAHERRTGRDRRSDG